MTARDRASELRKRGYEIKAAQRYEKDALALEDKRQALEGYRCGLQAAVASAGVLVKNGCLTRKIHEESDLGRNTNAPAVVQSY